MPPFAKGRHVPGQMNQTERRYADRLTLLKLSGAIAGFWFEKMKLLIGPNCQYTVDFLVMLPDGQLECHEVKGGWAMDDAVVKFKSAAQQFPFVFRWCVWKDKCWTITTPYESDRS